ncbi:MAG: hypothetical protein OXI57_00875 [Rhodospirillales bacterium]|nr:hypothetical protein [Rhodospirillales bacterium]
MEEAKGIHFEFGAPRILIGCDTMATDGGPVTVPSHSLSMPIVRAGCGIEPEFTIEGECGSARRLDADRRANLLLLHDPVGSQLDAVRR